MPALAGERAPAADPAATRARAGSPRAGGLRAPRARRGSPGPTGCGRRRARARTGEGVRGACRPSRGRSTVGPSAPDATNAASVSVGSGSTASSARIRYATSTVRSLSPSVRVSHANGRSSTSAHWLSSVDLAVARRSRDDDDRFAVTRPDQRVGSGRRSRTGWCGTCSLRSDGATARSRARRSGGVRRTLSRGLSCARAHCCSGYAQPAPAIRSERPHRARRGARSRPSSAGPRRFESPSKSATVTPRRVTRRPVGSEHGPSSIVSGPECVAVTTHSAHARCPPEITGPVRTSISENASSRSSSSTASSTREVTDTVGDQATTSAGEQLAHRGGVAGDRRLDRPHEARGEHSAVRRHWSPLAWPRVITHSRTSGPGEHHPARMIRRPTA